MGILVIGSGAAGTWSNDASAVTYRDVEEKPSTGRLFRAAQKAGACDRDGNMIGEGWLLVVGDHVAESDLDSDPSVIAYCHVD